MYQTHKKGFTVVPPVASISGASAAALVIDTYAFDYLELWVLLGALAADMTALKLQESDVKASATALTGGVDISGTIFATDANDAGSTSVLPTTASDANKIYKFEIDLRGRKRYILLVATAGAGATYISALAELGRGQQMPTSASDKNVAQLMRV